MRTTPRAILYWILLGIIQSFPCDADGIIEAGLDKNLNQIELLQELGLNVGGWLSMGETYYKDNTNYHLEAPISFNDRSSEFQVNQFNLFMQKPIDLESNNWNMGGRLDVMFGTDSRFTQATGLDAKLINEHDLRFYDIAIPQAYLEIATPIIPGLSVKLGHFYTTIGYEVVTAPNNFFYSHSYAMQYAEPFTHSGILLGYVLNENFTLNAGSVTGWNNFDQSPAKMNFLGGLSWTNDEANSTASWALISGDVSNSIPNNRTLSSFVASHNFAEQWQYVFQFDLGYQSRATTRNEDAYWYGINQGIFYDFTDTVSAGFRCEWLRDADGVLLSVANPGNYFAFTAGLNWKPKNWLTLRPELRYDRADTSNPVFNEKTQNYQFEAAMDIVIGF